MGSFQEVCEGKDLAAVFMSRAFTWSGVSDGVFCSNRAAVPETIGVAMLVPLNQK